MPKKPAAPKKAKAKFAKRAVSPAEAMRSLMEEIGDEDPRRMPALLAKLRAIAEEGGAKIVEVAQELGALAIAARFADVPLVEALLAAGVDPNVGQASGINRGRLALEAAFSSGAKPAVIDRIVEALLAHGASVDLPSLTVNRSWTALETAAWEDSTRWLERLAPLASERTRAEVLIKLLAAADPERQKAAIGVLHSLTPATVDVGDGLTPLHAAAIGGNAKLLRAMLVPELPRLSATIWFRAGIVSDQVRIERGATPLGAALATREAAVAKQQLDSAHFASWFIKQLADGIARLDEVIGLLERAGAVDGREAAASTPAHPTSTVERVIGAFTPLAAALGHKQFPKLAANIDPKGKGPINAMNACRQLLQKKLDAPAKSRLDRTLFGKCVTGTIDALKLEIVGEREEFAEDEPELASYSSPSTSPKYLLDLDRYPQKLRQLLKPQPPNVGYLGADGETVLVAEKRDTGTVVYEVTPKRVVEHDALVWIESGVAELVEAMRAGS